MRLTFAAALCFLALGALPSPAATDMSRWQTEASQVTIVRDDWGIAHVHGTTDAAAVFGAIYAQAEDDFNRIETNYLTALGRTAEYSGESAIYADLRAKLYADPSDLRATYTASPPALRALMDAWADGLNYYLATHPSVKPHVITRFEPWMALSFTEGSIGGDVERISLDKLRAFYGSARAAAAPRALDVANLLRDPGSNGIAIAPSKTRDGHALLLINPHTSFYFRSELQMSSDEGLNAYGASTWGQFFIYQGFNERAGWMHTSTGVDNVDFFAETISRHDGRFYYRYGTQERPLKQSTIVVPYRTSHGTLAQRSFTVYRTHRGPIVAEVGGKWICVAMMDEPVAALSQSFYRTKATDFASYRAIAARYMANSSNNTIFADSKGEIAFMTPQFVPRRDDRFDYTQPVDGSNPAADWHGLLPIADMPDDLNPPNGWVFNSNDWPYSSAGRFSPKRSQYPRYFDTAGENERGVHATMLLSHGSSFTIESLRALAYDSFLPAFSQLLPRLFAAYDELPSGNPMRARLAGQIGALRAWNVRWSASSVATSLAIYWGDAMLENVRGRSKEIGDVVKEMLASSPDAKLNSLAHASDRLTADFGTWRTPWGEINRFQRRNDDIDQRFDDRAPSIPVPFTSGLWGSLAAFYTVRTGTKRRYGNDGNSFVAVVEFGDKVRAIGVTAGGESGDPSSPHFDDQAARYATGNLREIYFYPDQLASHTERTYHPGDVLR